MFSVVGRVSACQGPLAGASFTNAWQDKRKLPLRCRSCSVRSDRISIPSVTSTMHSLHFPCLRQEGGTCKPIPSAQSKRETPSAAGGVTPLMVTATNQPSPPVPLLRLPPPPPQIQTHAP